MTVPEPHTVARAKHQARVLVVDDDLEIGRAVSLYLSNSFQVAWVRLISDALERLAAWHPDILILDLALPDGDGIAACREIRTWSAVPIIILSVRDSVEEKVAALESGADDYLTKPFSPTELLARLRVALRHAAHATTDTLFQAGDLVIDLARRTVHIRSQEVHLSPTEYAILTYLANHVGQVVTHHLLLRAVWGPQFEDAIQILRVNIATLRRKLERDPARPKLLITLPGIGYRLDTSAAE